MPRWLRSERQRASRNHRRRPGVRLPVGSRHVVSTIHSLRSLLDHLVCFGGRAASTNWLVEQRAPASDQSRPRRTTYDCRSAHGTWSRLSTRFARCSTTLFVSAAGGQHQLAGRAASASERSVETTRRGLGVRLPVGSRHVVSTIHSLRSLLDHLVCFGGRAASAKWLVEQRAPASDQSRPPDRRTAAGRLTARGLDYPLASLAARPPCLFRRSGGQHQLAGRAASASERSVETTSSDVRRPDG